MKKGLVIIMALVMLFAMTSIALAKQEANLDGNTPAKGNIVANEYTPTGHAGAAKDYDYYEQGVEVASGYADNGLSTHVYGTWNSPYTLGIDGYNYNDAQDYVNTGDQVDINGVKIFTSGPHGGYLTSTHRCRECHAVHRAAGKFKLLRSDTRFEACDWCHGTGAGSGFNIQMDNNDNYTTEYNVGHTMGYGIESGKWKAPDDTFPAFTPNYWQGGFSCFDCHSPHANPQRLLGYNNAGQPQGLVDSATGKVYGIANPGHDLRNDNEYHVGTTAAEPIFLSGSWLLIKNADREIAVYTEDSTATTGMIDANDKNKSNKSAYSIVAGQEIPDTIMEPLSQFSTETAYPVNKIPTDWNSPIGASGSAATGMENAGYNKTGLKRIWNVNEFCADCHDGNAGLHTVQAPLFSEDRALRNQTLVDGADGSVEHRGSYDLAYGHDAQPRH